MTERGERPKRRCVTSHRGTYVRSSWARVALLTCVALGLVGATLPASASASWPTPAPVGVVTHDGFFFAQGGGPDVFGTFIAAYNGSQVYTYAFSVNVTSLTNVTETATVHLYDMATHKFLGNGSVIVSPFASEFVNVTLPAAHSWTQIRMTVDGTPMYFYVQTPYTFLSLTNLPDGGLDFLAFVVLGEFALLAFPVMLKSERMTKRAIYAPKFNATMWLHGIFFGLVALYFVDFPILNMGFRGWEFIAIPLPEIAFIFFWNAGRHSTNTRALFQQGDPREGRPLGFILAFLYVGEDEDGNLVAMRERSIFQWWYRSRGHHTKVFVRNKAGVQEPMAFKAIEVNLMNPNEVSELARLPRSGDPAATEGFRVLNRWWDDTDPITRVYFVPRISAFKLEWPRMRITKQVLVKGKFSTDGRVRISEDHWADKLCWPYIEDGRAEITLAGWHYQDVWAINFRWMEAEDLVAENDELALQLWTERAQRDTESSRKADERLTANRDILRRPVNDLPDAELKAGVVPKREHRRQLPLSSGDSA